MGVHTSTLNIRTRGKGTTELTESLHAHVRASGLRNGLLNVFCQHTSCSLVIMENADPSARQDLEDWLERLVPPDDPHFTHTAEGPDDMPSHIKMALTRSCETIPFAGGQLQLGTWQGVFLWEHRTHPHSRRIVLTALGE